MLVAGGTASLATRLRRKGAKVIQWPLGMSSIEVDEALRIFSKRYGHLHGAVNIELGDYVPAQAFKMLETGGGTIVNVRCVVENPFASNGIVMVSLEESDGVVKALTTRHPVPSPAWNA